MRPLFSSRATQFGALSPLPLPTPPRPAGLRRGGLLEDLPERDEVHVEVPARGRQATKYVFSKIKLKIELQKCENV